MNENIEKTINMLGEGPRRERDGKRPERIGGSENLRESNARLKKTRKKKPRTTKVQMRLRVNQKNTWRLKADQDGILFEGRKGGLRERQKATRSWGTQELSVRITHPRLKKTQR